MVPFQYNLFISITMMFQGCSFIWITVLLPVSSAIQTYDLGTIPDGQMVELSADMVYSGRLEYTGQGTCDKTVTVLTKWFNADKLMLYFERFDIGGAGGNCSDSYLQIFDGTTTNGPTLTGLAEKLCGNQTITGIFVGATNALTFKYVTSNGRSERWRVTFTAFHVGHCMSYEYRCKNERCISHSLRCGGYNPCGDNSDCLMTYGAIAAVALGCVCAVGSLLAVILVLYKNRKRLYRHKRQPHTFTPAQSFENLTSSDFCQESITSLDCPPSKY